VGEEIDRTAHDLAGTVLDHVDNDIGDAFGVVSIDRRCLIRCRKYGSEVGDIGGL